MGSCFANEVRNSFQSLGFPVRPALSPQDLALFSSFSHEIPAWGVWDERVHYQWYTPASLHLEAQIAFCPEKVARRSIFPCTKGDRVVFQDPHRRLVFADSEENLIRLRAAMDEGIRQAFQHAQAFVFTLGLTEAWWIKATDLPACAEPDYGNPDSKPLCYFRNLDFASTLYYVEDLLRLIRKFRGPEVPIFISVSPIPLARTFRETDIAAANMESKSILRTVAGQVTESTPETIYFPSYELCVLDPEAFESEDGRHVKKTKVRSIIDLFYQAHVKRR